MSRCFKKEAVSAYVMFMVVVVVVVVAVAVAVAVVVVVAVYPPFRAVYKKPFKRIRNFIV